jgi:hypothetical protein
LKICQYNKIHFKNICNCPPTKYYKKSYCNKSNKNNAINNISLVPELKLLKAFCGNDIFSGMKCNQKYLNIEDKLFFLDRIFDVNELLYIKSILEQTSYLFDFNRYKYNCDNEIVTYYFDIVNRIRKLCKFYYAIQETVPVDEIINGYPNPFKTNSLQIHYEDMIEYEKIIDSWRESQIWQFHMFFYYVDNTFLEDQVYNLPYPKDLIFRALIKYGANIERVNTFCEYAMRKYKKYKLLKDNSLKSICMRVVLNNKMDLKYAYDIKYYYGLAK